MNPIRTPAVQIVFVIAGVLLFSAVAWLALGAFVWALGALVWSQL